ncbi:hypothetical protein STVA_14940 [Allostella vacuolata]|nr:hypothetical protein STVA_14940 [Stella vacuolata]
MRRSGLAGAVLPSSLLLLAACGSSGPVPSETTAYSCALGRTFQVTLRPGDPRVALEAGRNRLILGPPEAAGEEKPKPKEATLSGLYTNGIVSLQLNGEQATLENAPGGPYDNCRAAGPAEKTGPGIPPLKVE